MTAFDLTDPAFVADPYPALAALREKAPVTYHEPSGRWLALSYRHASQMLRDRRFGRIWRDREPVEHFAPFNALHRHQMMENEPPQHTRLRSLVAKAFSRGHIERLRPRITEIAASLLDGVGEEFDLLTDYAEPLPVRVIAELLGVPATDQHLLRPWSAAIVAMYEYRPGAATEAAAVQAAASRAAIEFADYVRALVRDRRAAPAEDLISHLVSTEGGPGPGGGPSQRLTEDELVATAILLLNAGHEASVNALGNGMIALLRHPRQLAWLRADPDRRCASAVAEMLRYDPPLQLFERTAMAAVRLGEAVLPAGGTIAALLGAANRDPAVFAEPDRFDLDRAPNPHVSFGAGLHFCLGAPLARLELAAALSTLLACAPGLELAGQPVRRPTFVLRGYRSIPVRQRGKP